MARTRPDAPRRSNAVVIAGVAIALPLIIGGAALGWMFAGDGALLDHIGYGPPCVVDANGKGALDVAIAMQRVGRDKADVRVLDGDNGETLWATEARYEAAYPKLICLDEQHFAVIDGFTVELHEPGDSQRVTAIRAPDQPIAVASGDQCFVVETTDTSSLSLSTVDGTATTCNAPEPLNIHRHAPGMNADSLSPSFELSVGAIVYAVKPKERGTPMLTVSATNGEEALWSRSLDLKAPGRRVLLAVDDDKVYTVGHGLESSTQTIFVALDRATGERVWTESIHDELVEPGSLVAAGDRLYLGIGWGVMVWTTDGEYRWAAGKI